MKNLLMIAVLLLFLVPPLPGQTNTVGGIIETRTSPGTSNTPSFGGQAELNWNFIKERLILVARGGMSSEQKIYRVAGGRGVAVRGMVDVRWLLRRNIFVSGGGQGGQVSYPEYRQLAPAAFVEPAYTKRSFQFRAGGGWQLRHRTGWYVAQYAWIFPDRTTFDLVNGRRVGNRARGHEISADSCLTITGRFCLGYRIEYRRLLFEQPYAPVLGTLKANQITAGLRFGWFWKD